MGSAEQVSYTQLYLRMYHLIKNLYIVFSITVNEWVTNPFISSFELNFVHVNILQ